jgi:hypothetical protein
MKQYTKAIAPYSNGFDTREYNVLLFITFVIGMETSLWFVTQKSVVKCSEL